jgi:uncharacterized membrane protein
MKEDNINKRKGRIPMHAHTIEGVIIGAVLITGFIISQFLQHRHKRGRR